MKEDKSRVTWGRMRRCHSVSTVMYGLNLFLSLDFVSACAILCLLLVFLVEMYRGRSKGRGNACVLTQSESNQASVVKVILMDVMFTRVVYASERERGIGAGERMIKLRLI